MGDDVEYGNAVYRLRHRRCTQSDVDLFNSRCTRSLQIPWGINMAEKGNIDGVALVHTNKLHELLNAKKAFSNTAAPNGQNLITCAANDLIHNDPVPTSSRLPLLRKDFSSIQGSLCSFLPLYEGMPVILRCKNISTDLKITNSSQGILRKLFTSCCNMGLTYAMGAIVDFPLRPVKLAVGISLNLSHGLSQLQTCIWMAMKQLRHA
jgi:hypothetical protein